ncbi:hypothetical protein Taro_049268 [Colocasia esculenta]|uniref:Uncharacterized protein n=1 Tax=Colocasia esculenta TaxID=4460 RepID=A0A843XAG6_COLES|nr:hypothetical protein [Colocasia esculenta]
MAERLGKQEVLEAIPYMAEEAISATKLHAISQGGGEPARDYIRRWMNVYRKYKQPISEEEAINICKNNLQKEILNRMGGIDIRTFDRLNNVATDIEAFLAKYSSADTTGQRKRHVQTLEVTEGEANGFRRWLVQWFEATETAYYCASDFPHTRYLGGICSCILGGWFCSRLRVGDMDVGAPPEHYTGKSFDEAIASVPAGVNPQDWQIMCAKWNTSDEQNIADRNKANRSHQSMPYRKGRKSHYQVKDDFRLAHDREPSRVEIFKIGRCKELPDGNEQWVDDESRSRYERMMQLSTPSLDSESGSIPISVEETFVSVMGKDRSGRIRCGGSRETRRTWYGTGEGSSSTDYQQWISNIENTLRMEVEELRTEARRRDSEVDEMRRELEQLRKRDSEMDDIRRQMLQMRQGKKGEEWGEMAEQSSGKDEERLAEYTIYTEMLAVRHTVAEPSWVQWDPDRRVGYSVGGYGYGADADELAQGQRQKQVSSWQDEYRMPSLLHASLHCGMEQSSDP